MVSDELPPAWRAIAVVAGTFDPPTAAAVWDVAPERALATLERLVAAGLVTQDAHGAGFHIEDTARDLIEAGLTEAERAAGERRLALYTSSLDRPATSALDLRLDVDGSTDARRGLALPSRHQLRPPPADFAGRGDELTLLKDAVNNGTHIVEISGLGGIGKTALALKLGQQLTASHPDAQLLVNLRGATEAALDPAEAMARVIQAFVPLTPMPTNEANLAQLYRSVWAGQRGLLILDDARDVRQVEPLVPPDGCTLIVTSRQQLRLRARSCIGVRLGAMAPGEAVALLVKIAPRASEVAAQIAEQCDYLPLALRLVGLNWR